MKSKDQLIEDIVKELERMPENDLPHMLKLIRAIKKSSPAESKSQTIIDEINRVREQTQTPGKLRDDAFLT